MNGSRDLFRVLMRKLPRWKEKGGGGGGAWCLGEFGLDFFWVWVRVRMLGRGEEGRRKRGRVGADGLRRLLRRIKERNGKSGREDECAKVFTEIRWR